MNLEYAPYAKIKPLPLGLSYLELGVRVTDRIEGAFAEEHTTKLSQGVHRSSVAEQRFDDWVGFINDAMDGI